MLRVHHIGIVVSDADETTAQLQRAFGLDPRPGQDISGGALNIQFVDLGNCSLEIIQPLAGSHPSVEWLRQHGSGVHHVAFEVDNLTQEMQRLTALGLLPQEARLVQGAGPYVVLDLPPAAVGGFRAQLAQPTTEPQQ